MPIQEFQIQFFIEDLIMWKKIVLPLLFLSFCFYTGCAVNPITGKEELMLFPEQQDIELGQKYAPEVEKQLGGRIDDTALQNYINSVGQKIAKVSHKPYFEYQFVAVNHKSLNACALPGGHIFITKGMLKKLTSEAQLAGILGHEITHVVARDTSAAMSREIGLEILLTAAAYGGATRGVLTVADVAKQIIGLKYSRTDEKDADLGGLDYIVRAGYNPYGMVETMQMLEEENQEAPIEFLSTHPSPGNRVLYLKARIQTRYQNLPGLKTGEQDYKKFVLDRLPPDKDSSTTRPK